MCEIENSCESDFSVSALVCQLEMESFPRAKLFFQHENGNFWNEAQPSGGSFHLNAGKIVRRSDNLTSRAGNLVRTQ